MNFYVGLQYIQLSRHKQTLALSRDLIYSSLVISNHNNFFASVGYFLCYFYTLICRLNFIYLFLIIELSIH